LWPLIVVIKYLIFGNNGNEIDKSEIENKKEKLKLKKKMEKIS